MNMIHKGIPSRHIPRVDQFSGAITDYISDLGSKKKVNYKNLSLGSSGVEQRTENPCVGGSNPPLNKT